LAAAHKRLTTCLETRPQFANIVSCFPFPTGNTKHRIFVCGLFANTVETRTRLDCKQSADNVCRTVTDYSYDRNDLFPTAAGSFLFSTESRPTLSPPPGGVSFPRGLIGRRERLTIRLHLVININISEKKDSYRYALDIEGERQL
jgi:hypothetical protein